MTQLSMKRNNGHFEQYYDCFLFCYTRVASLQSSFDITASKHTSFLMHVPVPSSSSLIFTSLCDFPFIEMEKEKETYLCIFNSTNH